MQHDQLHGERTAERGASPWVLKRSPRRGSALVPTLIVVSALATLGLAMLSSSMEGARTVNFETDEYRLTSAVESLVALTAEELWTDYIQIQGGAAGGIDTFRQFLDNQSVPVAGPSQAIPPEATDGIDLLQTLTLPQGSGGSKQYHNVTVDAIRLVRIDDVASDSTRLYFTVTASTQRGRGIVNPVLNRGLQVMYTVEPASFDGFDYGILANNVNCIFCHAQVDSTERYWNRDGNQYGGFDRIKVGTLESLMIRHDMDGNSSILNDYDADSYIAGTLYSRGAPVDHAGVPIANWNALSMGTFQFDATGKVIQDNWGNMTAGKFTPAPTPLQPLQNLYDDYPTNYNQMVDGGLPDQFPPPIPDDGAGWPGPGVNPYAGNRTVDQSEFNNLATTATGAIVAGVLTHKQPGQQITTTAEYATALFTGNVPSLGSVTTGNVVLSGTQANPIVIDGTVAIDGDVIIQGWVKGTGTVIARGNIYVPTDLQYLDATTQNGDRAFGLAADRTSNALGLAAGGNVLLGDFMKPTTLQPNLTRQNPGKYVIVSGNSVQPDGITQGMWSFSLAEMSLFNRTEWSRTQPTLPSRDSLGNPITVTNPEYAKYNPPGNPYLPRYYHFGPGDEVPIYNQGNLYFDTVSGHWLGDDEVPLE